MGNRRHFVMAVAGWPGRIAGAVLVCVPVWGMAMGNNFSASEWASAQILMLPGFVLLFGHRGVSVDLDSRKLRVWYGLALVRQFVLPLWSSRRSGEAWRAVLIRMHESFAGKVQARTNVYAVVLAGEPKRKFHEVSRHLSYRGATRAAEALARDTGLPLRD